MRRRRGIMGLNGGAGIPVIAATATGNPLTFETDLARPLQSLVIPFTPIQSGSGDPSPDNVRPISGWTGCAITHVSENLIPIDGGRAGYIITPSARLAAHAEFWTSDYFELAPGDYVITSIVNADVVVCLFPSNTAMTGMSRTYLGEESLPYHFTVSAQKPYCRISVQHYVITDNPGAILSKFVNVIPLTFTSEGSPLTVYGGTLTLNEDGSVDLVADREYKRYTGENSEGWRYSSWTHQNNAVFYSNIQVQGAKYTNRNYNYIKNCNMFPIITYDELSGQDIAGITITGGSTGFPSIGIPKSVLSTVDVTGLTSYLSANPLDIIYELATPITYHFDNIGQLTTFIGTNTIWTDTNGTNTATYLKHQS